MIALETFLDVRQSSSSSKDERPSTAKVVGRNFARETRGSRTYRFSAR